MGLWLVAGAVLGWGNVSAEQRAPLHFDHRARQLEFTETGDRPFDSAGLREVRIGWFGPSDPADPVGGDLWVAAQVAVAGANEAGGWEGRPFRLLPRWAVNPWGTGVSLLFRMVYEEDVVALLGSIDSPSTHLAEQVVAKARLPLVSPVSTDKSVNLAGVSWMFSVAPSDAAVASIWAEAMAGAIAATRGTLVLVNSTEHDARQQARELLGELRARRLVPVRRLEFTPGGETFLAQLRVLAGLDPQVVALVAGPEDSARLVRGLRQSGVSATVYGGPRLAWRCFRELAGEAAEGVRFPLLVDAVDEEGWEAFRERFVEAAGHEPDGAAVLTYDATRLLLEAIRVAGPDRQQVRETLRQLSPWPGVGGVIEWDGLGQNRRPVARMGVFAGGRIVPMDSWGGP